MSTTARSPASAFSYPDVQLFIAGQWRAGQAGETLSIKNPATDAVIGRLAVARQPDLDAEG